MTDELRLLAPPVPAIMQHADAALIQLDLLVDRAEDNGIRARWEFGRTLLRERIGKQLPPGRIDQLVELTGKSERELRYRAQFAERCQTETEVGNAIADFGSWYAIVNVMLPGVGAHVGHAGGENEWYSPAALVGAGRRVMGSIDLDPASSPEANEVVDATVYYTAADDGLVQKWKGRVWMNPPYAQPLIGDFCRKLVDSFGAGVTEACVLVNNATETSWFQTLAEVASAIGFPRGRVQFWHPNRVSRVSAPLQGQAIVYLGPNVNSFRVEFDAFGWTVER